jgi:hypothetical protein
MKSRSRPAQRRVQRGSALRLPPPAPPGRPRVRRDTEDRNAASFNALLDRDVTVIFANGGVRSGKREVSAFITDFFSDPGWTQTFRKLDEHVEGCRTGSSCSTPSIPYRRRTACPHW